MNDEINMTPGEGPSASGETISGVVLRTAEGTLYFISDRALETFRVTTTLGRAALQDSFASLAAAGQGGGGGPTQTLEAYHVDIPRSASMNADVLM